jgi:hypothetical protein
LYHQQCLDITDAASDIAAFDISLTPNITGKRLWHPLLTHCSNGAISSVNLLQNPIGIDQAKALASILKEHPTLKSICGNSGEETELDMSGKEIGAEGAIMLAPEIAGNGALTKLTFGDKQVVTMTTEMTEANFSGKLKTCAFEAQIVAAFLPKCT